MRPPPDRQPAWALACLLTSLAALPVQADLRYRPKAEETLSHIALIHYGDPKKMIYLTTVNGIGDPDRLPSGKRLTIPVVETVKVQKGDDLARLAKRHLGDAKRADFLAWLNQIKDAKELKIGASLVIPFVLEHSVQEGQSMLDVARRYYWSTRPAGLLRKFNGRRTNALKPGESVAVPIYDREAQLEVVKKRLQQYQERERREAEEARERARKEAQARAASRPGRPDSGGPTEAARPEGEGPPTLAPEVRAALGVTEPTAASTVTSRRAEELLADALGLFRAGDFELAQAALTRLLEGERLAQEDEARARSTLAQCLVALDRPKDAEHEFVRLLMVEPDKTFDPITTSPKVLEVFQRARGGR